MGDFGYPVRRVPFTHYNFTQPVNPLNGLGNRGERILAAHRDFETNKSFETFKLRSGSAARAMSQVGIDGSALFFPSTTIVAHCRALIKNQAQDTRCKNTNSVAFYNVFSGIWGSLGLFSSLEGRLQVCAHGYTQGLVFFVVQISRSGTILYPIIYNKYI
ncbi:hypothetical protein B0H14DRAFT_3145903 [Mycena olivaceomarginata]|nr:hypothetical protein B0H14DRAFT_3145903 [Mycena olivaceomarginata]